MSAGTKRFYCEHYQDFVCKTAYHQHKCLYFDKSNKQWSSEQVFAEADLSSSTAFIPTSLPADIAPTVDSSALENSADTFKAVDDRSQSPIETREG